MQLVWVDGGRAARPRCQDCGLLGHTRSSSRCSMRGHGRGREQVSEQTWRLHSPTEVRFREEWRFTEDAFTRTARDVGLTIVERVSSVLHDTRTPTPADVLNLLVDKVVLQRVVTATNKTLSSRSRSPISYDELKLFFGTWMMATCYAIPLKQIEDVGVRGASTVCVPLGCSPVPFQLWPSRPHGCTPMTHARFVDIVEALRASTSDFRVDARVDASRPCGSAADATSQADPSGLDTFENLLNDMSMRLLCVRGTVATSNGGDEDTVVDTIFNLLLVSRYVVCLDAARAE